MITVMVVDDDFRVARIHSTLVDRVGGFRTIGVAGNGAEALAMARRLVPDLILLDLYLPDVFGLDLLNQMRVAGVEGDVIVISAANESETVERALKLGAANYLLKPFTLDDLAGQLSEYQFQRQRRLRPLVGDQAEVDRIFGRSEPTTTESLPKGMSPETAELILAALRERTEEQSAQQCAAAVGISRVSARRYLEFFVSQAGPRCRCGTAAVVARSADTGLPPAVTPSSSSDESRTCSLRSFSRSRSSQLPRSWRARSASSRLATPALATFVATALIASMVVGRTVLVATAAD